MSVYSGTGQPGVSFCAGQMAGKQDLYFSQARYSPLYYGARLPTRALFAVESTLPIIQRYLIIRRQDACSNFVRSETITFNSNRMRVDQTASF